jgi:hypothetical protein
MTATSTSTRVLGAAFLLQATTSLAGGTLLDSYLVVPGNIGATMIKIAQHPFWMRANLLDELVTAIGIVWLGALLFTHLRRFNETAARTAFALYILEAAILAVSRIGAYMLLTVSQQYASAGRPAALEPLGRLASSALDGGYIFMMLPFCAGAFLFYLLLHQSRIVPRWLPVWGLAAMIPLTIGTLSATLGLKIWLLEFAPYIPFEFVLGLWFLLAGIRTQEPREPASPLVILRTHQHVIQRFVLPHNPHSQHPQPSIHRLDPPSLQSPRSLRPLHPRRNHPRLLQHFQVLRDRRLRHRKRPRQLRHRRLPQRQPPQNRAPRRISQR